MTKPKIAVLIDWYLPGTKAGGPVRSVFSLINLMQPFFDFYVITTNSDLGSTVPYQDVNANSLFQKNGVNYYYFSREQLNQDSLVNVINNIQPNLIYLNSFWSAHFSVNIVRLKYKKVIQAPVLLAPRGMLGKGALGIKPIKKQIFLLLSKFFTWHKSVSFHATQEQEVKDILNYFPKAKILVAPNVNSGAVCTNKSSKNINTLSLFFLSRISRVKNLHYALHVLKTIQSTFTVTYDIYGNIEDKDYWQECEEIISALPTNIKVNYKGELAFDKVSDSIKNYNALLMPTLNENYGHSIVESLLCGCLPIISNQTPWNDLEDAGYSLDLNHPESFAAAINELAGLSETDFKQRSQNAINYITKKINLSTITQQYNSIFNASIKN